jgi:DNA-binding beta-propeller fold protein YncE
MKPNRRVSGTLGKVLLLLAIAALAVGGFVLYKFWPSLARISPRELTNMYTFAGANHEFGEPFGVAIRSDEIYVSDGQAGKILKVSKTGTVSTFAQGLDTPSGIAFDKNGDLLVADSGSNSIKKIDGKGTTTIAGLDGEKGFADGDESAARFNGPIGIAATPDGTIYVADTYNDRIRVIRNGVVTTIAGNSRGFADGSGMLAKFDTPCGLALMANGDLLVADLGNARIRLVRPDGETTTLVGTGRGEFRDGFLGAADLVAPVALAVGESESIFVADGNSIRVIRTDVFPYLKTITGKRRGMRDGSLFVAEFNRPSGIALDSRGRVFVADTENQIIRVISMMDLPPTRTHVEKFQPSADEFKTAAPPRWPYDPPGAKREIAGTMGEIRGEIDKPNTGVWFHNGLDIVGSYGETARFVRDEKVYEPLAVENFGTLRELIRMPTMGYIHIRIGRDQNEKPFPDDRFQFEGVLKPTSVRVPRGTKFLAGEPIGTLNPMNHVHLIAGRSGAEMNALDALILPGSWIRSHL